MNEDFKTQILLKNGLTIVTESPVIYSGEYLMVTEKTSSRVGDVGYVTSHVYPYSLSEIKLIITKHATKIYKTDEN